MESADVFFFSFPSRLSPQVVIKNVNVQHLEVFEMWKYSFVHTLIYNAAAKTSKNTS